MAVKCVVKPDRYDGLACRLTIDASFNCSRVKNGLTFANFSSRILTGLSGSGVECMGSSDRIGRGIIRPSGTTVRPLSEVVW